MVSIKTSVYLFDLDATLTKEELLPRIARLIGIEKELQELTRLNMENPNINFETSFRKRVELLSSIPISDAQYIVETTPMNLKIVEWINLHPNKCFIVTGNLDLWVQRLFIKYNLQGFTSRASMIDGKLKVDHVVDKSNVIRHFSNHRVVYIGDGSNDIRIMNLADVGIISEIVHPAPDLLWDQADFVCKTEESLCRILSRL